MYIFPLTFFFFLNTSSSGLSWYYFVSNALNILISFAIKYWILDEKKIHARFKKIKTPKPEGKFQERICIEMMEKAQETKNAKKSNVKKMNKK